ncbi:rhodopsin (plasmid) [Deinococcus aetherius]|uniref:Rhodopsin n=1 Tax=Deinococcus aetherius TaxID=200252 RepID=A0ABM8AJS7_9DEIO|nr:bacteriorhodopsin [Deinococcus aetherius]BDP44073.1 rhodopsin [Deinococcus aetherius]
MNETVALWNWIGFGGMLIGALLFFPHTRRPVSEYARQSYLGLFLVPLIAMLLYLMLALGQGRTEVEGRTVSWIRYVTWILTTPLLLNQLARLVRAPGSFVAALLVSNTLMIGTGALADLSPTPQRYVWYGVSCAAFVAVFFLLYSDFTRRAGQHGGEVERTFRRLRDVNFILWLGYPVVWILGTSGVRVLDSGLQAALYTLLDLAAKVGFGLLVLSGRDLLERVGTVATQNMESGRLASSGGGSA